MATAFDTPELFLRGDDAKKGAAATPNSTAAGTSPGTSVDSGSEPLRVNRLKHRISLLAKPPGLSRKPNSSNASLSKLHA